MSWLERAAAERPGHPAVEAPDGSLSYAELLAAARGREPEPLIPSAPTLDFAVALHSCLLHGVPAVPVDPRLTDAERSRITVPDALPARTALVVYTSGTTGEPRPVALRSDQVERAGRATAEVLGLGGDDRWLCVVPLSHVAGLMILARCVLSGTTAVLDRFVAEETAVRLAGDVDVVSLVPTMLGRVLDAGLEAPPRLRAVVLGGAGAPRALLERAAAAGVPVRPSYGLTQTCGGVTMAAVGDLDTAGPPLPGMDVAVAGDGEIVVDGAVRTGDLGRVEPDGRLVVLGRKVDTIITGGENVMPAEVEAVLVAHPEVVDAGVFARPHPEWGEAVCAQVVLRPGAAMPDLSAWCGDRLAPFKVPKTFEEVAVLPRTPAGKLLRRLMR